MVPSRGFLDSTRDQGFDAGESLFSGSFLCSSRPTEMSAAAAIQEQDWTCAGDAKIGPNGRTQLAGTEMALDCCNEHCMQGPPHSEHRPMLCCTAKANALNGPPRRYAMHPTLLLRGYLLSTRRDLAKELPWLSTVMLPIPGPKLALRSMRARESSDNSGWGPL